MRIFNSIEEFHAPHDSIALSIGNFDGVHLGHLAILRRLKELAPYSCVITFSNHPSEILHQVAPNFILSPQRRLSILADAGIDGVIFLPFTKTIASLSAEQFLRQLKHKIPFQHLVLGYDAVIGHNRKGDPSLLLALSQTLDFSLEYLEPVQVDNIIVSSRAIRSSIQNGNFQTASRLLGRPYSIKSQVIKGEGKGKSIGIPTANLCIENLTLPPLGVYRIEAIANQQTYSGIANLGHAPTLHFQRQVMLEAHLFDFNGDLYDHELEVFFLDYLRPEKIFSSVSELIHQVNSDIQTAKDCSNRIIGSQAARYAR